MRAPQHSILAVRAPVFGPAFALVLGILAGCQGESHPDGPDPAEAKPAGVQVRVSGEGEVLGDAPESRVSPEELVARVEGLLEEGRLASARRRVARFPDVALTALRNVGPREAGEDAIVFVARVHDEQARGASWATLLASMAASPSDYADFAAATQSNFDRLFWKAAQYEAAA